MRIGELLAILGDGLLGTCLPLALLSVGLIYMVALRGFLFLHPLRTVKCLFCGQKKEAFRALSMALAGTLGVGNIAGVALAVTLGGAGAVFWMWVSAALSMFLKFAEIVLAFSFRCNKKSTLGGAMYYMRYGIGGRIGGTMAKVFSAFCLLSAFTLGGTVQSNAMAECFRFSFGVPAWLSGVFLAFAVALVVLGGVRKIHALTEKLIPLLTSFYFLLALYACLSHANELSHVVGAICQDAFSPISGAAGVGGFLTARAVRYGVTRGLLSNEAGAGTAPMAHATAQNNPISQGVLGIAEVFIDTFVLCTATAFTVLLALPQMSVGTGGVSLVLRAFDTLVGGWTEIPIVLSVMLFVYATAVCWCYYGENAVLYWMPQRKAARWVYTLLFLMALAIGGMVSGGWIWHLTDVAVSMMTLVNLVALLVLLPHVVAQTKKSGLLFGRPLKRAPLIGKERERRIKDPKGWER